MTNDVGNETLTDSLILEGIQALQLFPFETTLKIVRVFHAYPAAKTSEHVENTNASI